MKRVISGFLVFSLFLSMTTIVNTSAFVVQGADSTYTATETLPVIVVDLSNVEWAREQIQSLVSRGVINGKSDSSDGIVFAPEDQITRAELTTLIVKAFVIQGSGSDASFSDVASDSWYYDYVGKAFKNQIINGTSDVTFDPEAPITRQDMATIIIRAMKTYQSKHLVDDSLINEKLNIFNDVGDIADYARVFVATAVDLGIINGTTDDGTLKFKPNDNTNRAEAAVVIYRMLDIGNDPDYDPNSYVATVGITKISKIEFEYYLIQNKIFTEQQSQVEDTAEAKKIFWEQIDPQSGITQAAKLKTATLDLLYTIQIEVDEALKKDTNVLQTQEPITKKTIIDEYAANKQSESEFINSIKEKFDLSYDAYIKIRTRYDVAVAHYNQAQKDIVFTDEEVQNYYIANKDVIDLITIKYSMYLTININIGQPLSAEEIEIARTKAEAALDRLNNGADIDQLIANESEDPNKAQGKGEAQFSLNPSSWNYLKDISDPLSTMTVNENNLIYLENQGYIVFKYIKKTTYEDVKDSVKSGMQGEEYQIIVAALREAKPLVLNQNGKIIDDIDILQYK